MACCKSIPGGLLLIPGGLLLIAAGGCYFVVVAVISWWLLVFSDALLLPFNPCKARYSAPRPWNKGCIVHNRVTHRFHRAPSPNAQATAGQKVLPNFEAFAKF